MEEYHGLIVDKSLQDLDIIGKYNVIGEKVDGDWTIYKIAINKNDLEKTIAGLQNNIRETEPWYIHIYNERGSKLIVIFKKAIFTTSADKDDWTKVVKYGLSLGIPEEQLDFYPNKFEEEF